MPAYDAVLFHPPAPVTRVVLRHPKTGHLSNEVPALLDTGADVTLIPQSAVAEIAIVPGSRAGYELAGFDGSVSLVESAELDLVLFNKTVRGLYLLYDRDYGILGRDVLNLVSLRFDGPRLRWHGQFGSAEV